MLVLAFFFFFQAEDGIRDGHVTGVQTCALPILDSMRTPVTAPTWPRSTSSPSTTAERRTAENIRASSPDIPTAYGPCWLISPTSCLRSEERRVGKECRVRAAGEQ